MWGSLFLFLHGEHKHLFALPLVPQHTQYVIIVTDMIYVGHGSMFQCEFLVANNFGND